MADEDEKFLDRPLDVVQGDIYVLDAIKGLDALAEAVGTMVMVRFPEFKEVAPLADDPDRSPDSEAIDDLHHFIRETQRFAKGARQQLEQRIFGGKNG